MRRFDHSLLIKLFAGNRAFQDETMSLYNGTITLVDATVSMLAELFPTLGIDGADSKQIRLEIFHFNFIL